MTLLARAVLQWEGWEGAPGVNVLHFSEGSTGGSAWGNAIVDGLYDELEILLDGLAGNCAPSVKAQVSSELAIIDSASGQIVDVKVPSSGPTVFTSAQTNGALPRATAALIRFGTDKFLNGKRLRGRMFLGPLAATQVDGSGKIVASLIDGMSSRWTALTTGVGPRLAVYHRPLSKFTTGGEWGDVVSVSCRSTPSNLRSRSI